MRIRDIIVSTELEESESFQFLMNVIKFKTLKWKNFLSTGDKWTEIDFQSHKTTLVVGHNGAGKSTMLDALSFALFGKAPYLDLHRGGFLSAALSVSSHSPGVTWRSDPLEPGLSSVRIVQRPSNRLAATIASSWLGLKLHRSITA